MTASSTAAVTLLLCGLFEFHGQKASAFHGPQTSALIHFTARTPLHLNPYRSSANHDNESESTVPILPTVDRRSAISGALSFFPMFSIGALLPASPALATSDSGSSTGAFDQATREPKFVQSYEDFTEAPEGYSYKDVKVGAGSALVGEGDRAVYEWSGYTIGYFGRPFERKGGPQGGAFDKDLDYARTVVGKGGGSTWSGYGNAYYEARGDSSGDCALRLSELPAQ